jgi:ABC-2 type transport system ATP-binding protein
LIRGLADAGKTIFLTTHYMFEADAICDRIAVIKKGSIVAEGTPASIKQLVEELGVVEFEAQGVGPNALQALRALAGVSSVSVIEEELGQRVTVRCVRPADVMTQLGLIFDGVALRRVNSRDPTLEDAYVQLVGDES